MTDDVKQKSYLTLHFDDGNDIKDLKISGKEDFLTYYYMLGKHAVLSDKQKGEEFLQDKENFFSTKNILSNATNMFKCLEKINLSTLSDDVHHLIDKEIVHKFSQDNVMITGIDLPLDVKVDLFVGDVNHTNEINLDHLNSDHVEAIFLTELCRQSSMVSLSKFLGSDSEYCIIEEFKCFKQFVQRDKKVFIHTSPVINKKSKGRGICLYTIYQSGKLCMSGYYQIIYTKKGDKND